MIEELLFHLCLSRMTAHGDYRSLPQLLAILALDARDIGRKLQPVRPKNLRAARLT
jgi:hypothetical protein